MFAYCGNNPICYRDDTGTYYTPGQIHNFVVQDICDNNPNKTKDNPQITYNSPISRGNKWYMYGFCDVYDKVTHEVWEVKRISNAASCSPDAAYEQLATYVSRGFLKSQSDWKLKFGGEKTSIRPNAFTVPDTDGKGMYLIGYFDAGYGLVYYDYAYIPSSGETVAAACAIICLYALFSGAGVTALGGIPGLLPA